MSRRVARALADLLVIAAFLVAHAAASESPAPSGPRLVPAESRVSAAKFRFRDPEGGEFTLADFREKLVVIELWATWCAPCLMELPEIAGLQKAARDDGRPLVVVPIHTDRKWMDVQRFLASSGLRVKGFKTYAAVSKVEDSFGPIRGLPTTILIDAGGNVAALWTGYSDRRAPLKPLLDELSHELPRYAPGR